ncbi:MAG TPA: hypothetical protein VI341_05080 [Actinomycetota bacterium]
MESPSADRLRQLSVPVVIGVLAAVLALSLWGFRSRDPVSATAVFSSAGGSTPPAATPDPVPLPAWWPERLTLYTDSVGLGAVTALRDAMPSWRVRVLGRPALMLDDAAQELADDGKPVDKVAVVALGYNSLWEHDREDFDYYSRTFDQDAARLVRTLRAAGARKIVWVLLRDAPRSVIPTDSLDQERSFAWYFPYVNARLRKLARERTDVVLADWASIGDVKDVTYDAIHLNPEGAALYARMVRNAIMHEPYEPEGAKNP